MPDKEWILMIKKETKLEYVLQRYNFIWYVLRHEQIIDHSQYQNDLVEKYNLEEVADGS